MRRRRASAVPIVIIIALLLVGIIGSTFAAPRASPSPTPDAISIVQANTNTPVPLPTPFGRYPTNAEATIVGSCVNGIDTKTVPPQIAQMFCVCTLNSFEQLYPTYDQFQSAIATGTITDQLRTQISTRCTQALLGG
ncbi:MAG: hypothetical protein ABI888_02355 [Chloroflexota bacterium]